MIELISIIASLVMCILIPIEVSKIRGGWARKKFAGDRAKFLAAYRAQLRLLIWLGIVFGLLGIGLAAVEAEPGEPTVKFVAAIIWFAVACISFIALRMLPKDPEPGPAKRSDA